MINISKHELSNNLILHLSPNSTTAEAYRTLRTNIKYASIDKKYKSIIITSPEMHDGKTVTACNLAISFANADNKVLLIDADLRKPNVHNQFGISNVKGLTNILLDKCSYDEVLFEVEDIPNLNIITSGTIPPNPSEIIASNKFKELINYFSENFDIVIIDTPPICYVSDGLMLAGFVDGVMITVSAKETNVSKTQSTVKALNKVDAKILGVVMTKVKYKNKEYYYY